MRPNSTRSTLTTRSTALGGLSLMLAVVAGSSGEGCGSSHQATPDGGASSVDGASLDSAPASCASATHLPAGFTQVLVSNSVVNTLTGAGDSRAQAMVLDENDDPMFAYASADTSSWSINFIRWDRCAGQFTAPLLVDTVNPTGPQPDLAIGYDPTTKEVGIAYAKPTTDNDWADSFGEIYLATMKAPATAFTLQELTLGSTLDNNAGGPSIAMAGGQVYVAFWDGPYMASYHGLVWLLSSSATPSQPNDNSPVPLPDGGTDDPTVSATDDAGLDDDGGSPPPHYFTYTAMPYPGGYLGYASGLLTSAAVSVAVDSNGAPAVAAYQDDGHDYVKEVLFWRPGFASAVSVYTFSIDGAVDLSLAFDGTKALIAGHMDSPTTTDDAGVPTLDTLAFFASSDDGATWGAGVHLPNNDDSQVTAFTSALAADGSGHVAVASNISGGVGGQASCGENPYIATASDDDGSGWTACGADTSSVHGYSSYSVSAVYGASRLKGTLTASFVNGNANPSDAGADEAGIIYWQHP